MMQMKRMKFTCGDDEGKKKKKKPLSLLFTLDLL